MISFPVIEALTIDKYGLIPSSRKEPFAIRFLPGQNAIVGVNGSGKTTLISIAMRCLTGPSNLPSTTSDTEFGHVRARVVPMQKPERAIFAKRVADGAVDARATLTVSFGAKTLTIVRKLSDLSLVACSLTPSDPQSDSPAHDQETA